MHKLGLCISYDWVMDISTDLANSVTAHLEQDGVVCPPKLRKDVFTTAGIDNIDHTRALQRQATPFMAQPYR